VVEGRGGTVVLPWRLRVWRGTRRLWSRNAGLILFVLLVGSLVLGFAGYQQYYDDEVGEPKSFFDLLYLDLELLTFSTQLSPTAPPTAMLQVARFMAPVVAGYGALRVLARLFRDRVGQARARLRRNHTVVAGAGETGMAFVRQLRGPPGFGKVVVVDDDPANVNLEVCRDLGALVVTADARRPEGLEQVGIRRAARLVVVCGADGTNAEVVLAAQQVLTERGPQGRRGRPSWWPSRPPAQLQCLAHIVDPDLWQLLLANELRVGHERVVRFDFFNLYEHGARALLEHHPPFRGSRNGAPTVLVVGDGTLAERVLVLLARRWDEHEAGARRVRIQVVAERATGVCEAVRRQVPQVERSAELDPIDADLDGLGLQAVAGIDGADIAYVVLESDADAIVAAQLLRTRLAEAPVVVSLAGNQGLARVVEDSRLAGPPGMRQIEPFPLLERTCDAEALLKGTWEGLAQAVHARYREDQLAEGADPHAPNLAPWDELAERYRESSRRQAADSSDKLRLVGCDFVPLRGWGPRPFHFTAFEVERMARHEHERWCRELEADGWTAGDRRDDSAKVHPLLRPWEELPDEVHEQNRRIVRAIPDHLASAGFAVVRVRRRGDPDVIERVARAIHERYLANRQAADDLGRPSTVPWAELGEGFRDSNRAQAAAIPDKLTAVGCRLEEAPGPQPFDGFTPVELEDLARLEHDRWVDERLAAGWAPGDGGERSSPDLVSWEDLPEARRQLDREAIRAIPEVVAAAGMVVVRGRAEHHG